MSRLWLFYRRTWWLWLLIWGGTIALATFLTPIYWFVLPGLILFSVYFGVVRGEE